MHSMTLRPFLLLYTCRRVTCLANVVTTWNVERCPKLNGPVFRITPRAAVKGAVFRYIRGSRPSFYVPSFARWTA